MTDVASLVLKVDATQVDTGRAALDKLADAGGVAEQAAAKMSSAYAKLGSVVAAAYSVWHAGGAIKDATLLAARYETLGISLYTAGQNAGYASHQMDAFQKGLEKTGISMVESRNTLIQMAASNMDLANATKLARAAQDLAVVGNVNSSESFNRLVYGIKSGQTEILRTLGLNVQFEQSYKMLAEQLHKNVTALTEQEKMQARTNIVMEAATQYAGIYEAAMSTSAKQLSSLARYHENLQVVMGSTFTEALAMVVAAYTGELKDLNAEAQDLKIKGDLKEWGRAAALTIAAVGDAARMTFNTVGAMATVIERLTVTAAILANPLASGVPRLRALQDELKQQQAEFTSGMADNLKLYNAVSAGFARNDAEDTQRKQKKLSTDARFAAQALLIMEAYSTDAVTMREKLTGLADVYGGDYAAQYGTPKTKSGDGSATDKKSDPFKLENEAWVRAKEFQIAQLEEAAKRQTELQRDMTSSALAAQAIYANVDPIYKASLAWEEYLVLVEGGYLDLETAGKAYAQSFGETTDQMTVFAKQAGKNIQDAFSEFLFDPFKGGLNGMLDGFTIMLRKMAAEALASQVLSSIGNWGKTGGGAGSIIGGIASAVFGGGKATGGAVSGGTTYLVGERGPELFTPSGSGNITPNDKLGGKSVTVINNFTLSQPTDRRTQEQIAAMAGASIQSAMLRGA